MTPQENIEIKRRLNRIKGQVEGILRMVEHPKPAMDIFTQITAAKKALDSAGRTILETYIKEHLPSVGKSREDGNKLKDIIDLIEKL